MSNLVTNARGLRGHRRSRFVRHYLEMVLVMLVAMMVFAPLWSLAAQASGWRGLVERSDLRVVAMATDMTVGMSLWMWRRGHRRRPTAEMAAAMAVPFLLLLGPLWGGVLSENAVLGFGHLLMLVAMAAVMLVRVDEYTHDHSRAAGQAQDIGQDPGHGQGQVVAVAPSR